MKSFSKYLLTIPCIFILLEIVTCVERSFSCISDSKIQLSYLFFSSTKRPCHCEPSWNEVVCKRRDEYIKMIEASSPSFCICRKYSNSDNKCLQFMMRCVERSDNSSNNYRSNDEMGKNYKVNKFKYKVSLKKKKNNVCSCCFNQPDEYCNHFSCQEMVPYFDQEKQTSCNCFSPSKFPYSICNSTGNNGPEMPRILNSQSNERLQFVKKHEDNDDDDDIHNNEIKKETEYKKISSGLRKDDENGNSIRMSFLTNGFLLNVIVCIMLIFVIGTIVCCITNSSKNVSQRSHSQIIDPNTEFLMDQRTDV